MSTGLLADKRCLLVGGTGGLGLAAARRFLEEGARLVIAGPDAAAGHDAAALASVGPCSFLCRDATQPEQVDSLFAATVDQLGGLDVLYHLAGASGRRFGDGALHECTDDGWQATLAVNLTS